MKIDQKTALYGVLGAPVTHSLGPVMHNAAFKEREMNAVYLAFETDQPVGCIEGMRALHIRGMSITIPYKSTVIPLLDEVDELAGKIGAVNTIVNRRGRLIGYNTDAIGALRALEERVSVRGQSCLIIGAGGAARAIGYIMKERGATITIANRSKERGGQLAAALEASFILLDDIDSTHPDILIQTTSVGMVPRTDRTLVPKDWLKENRVVMDIIYNPRETRLIRDAKSRGCTIIPGLEMFLHQGAEQFKLWTETDPPLEAMKDAVLKELNTPPHGIG